MSTEGKTRLVTKKGGLGMKTPDLKAILSNVNLMAKNFQQKDPKVAQKNHKEESDEESIKDEDSDEELPVVPLPTTKKQTFLDEKSLPLKKKFKLFQKSYPQKTPESQPEQPSVKPKDTEIVPKKEKQENSQVQVKKEKEHLESKKEKKKEKKKEVEPKKEPKKAGRIKKEKKKETESKKETKPESSKRKLDEKNKPGKKRRAKTERSPERNDQKEKNKKEPSSEKKKTKIEENKRKKKAEPEKKETKKLNETKKRKHSNSERKEKMKTEKRRRSTGGSKSSSTSEFIYIDENEYVERKHAVLSPEDVPECECYPIPGITSCGSSCMNRMMYIECVPGHCKCGDKCTNQRFQKKQYAKLEIFDTEKKGKGLKVLEDVKAGQFIIEYVGQVISHDRCFKRMKKYKHENKFYFLTIDANEGIDARGKGNKARFINHSCNPNCQTQKWYVNGEIRVGLFALKDIPAGKELTFDYQFERFGGKKQICYCGEPNCRGYLGAKRKEILQQKNSLPPTATLPQIEEEKRTSIIVDPTLHKDELFHQCEGMEGESDAPCIKDHLYKQVERKCWKNNQMRRKTRGPIYRQGYPNFSSYQYEENLLWRNVRKMKLYWLSYYGELMEDALEEEEEE